MNKNLENASTDEDINNIKTHVAAMAHDLHWGMFGIWILLALILWRVW